MSFFSRLFIVLALVLTLPASAQTSTKDDAAVAPSTPEAAVVVNGQKFGAWSVSCIAIAVGKTDCTLTQRVLRSTDKAFIADIVATRNPEGQSFLIARVPVGVFLPTGFAMREAESDDEEAVMQFAWQSCNREVCEAVLQIDADKVAALSTEENAMIAAFRPSAQTEPFLFQFSLNGMASGLDAVRP
ncbi:invasion associated locus B family protein [Sulfitobacter pacificus]|nr:invasion associated locus B family protein [Sulfitobacter pacificus]